MRNFFTHLFSALIVFSAFNCYAKNVAVIVGASEFVEQQESQNDLNLPVVYNNAQLMCSTLSDLSTEKFEIHRVYALRKDVDDSQKVTENNGQFVNYLPTKKNILTQIENALDGLTENDSVIIYIGSHGCVGTNQNDTDSILAFDSKFDDSSTMLQPKAEIRDTLLKNCKATSKILIIDTCTAGATRGGLVPKIQPESASDDNSNTVIFSSCGIAKSSNVTSNQSFSLFTYWLANGLKGYADGYDSSPHDGSITTTELQKYIDTNISLMSSHNDSKVIKAIDIKCVTVIKPQFKNPESALDDLAEQITMQLLMRNETNACLKNVTLSKYSMGSNTPEYNSALNSWTSYCSDELFRRVSDKCKQYQSNPITITQQDNGNNTTEISTTLQCNKSKDNNFELQCHFKTKSVETDLHVCFSMPEEELQVAQATRKEITPKLQPSNSNHQYKIVQTLEYIDNSNLVAEISFRVYNPSIRQYVARPIYLIDNTPYFPLNPGEKYRIYVSNKTTHSIMGRVLVDGKNTLPQQQQLTKNTPDISWPQTNHLSISVGNTAKLIIASGLPKQPAVNTRLGNARPWEFEGNQTSAILGFFNSSKDGKRITTYDEFVVKNISGDVKPDEYSDEMGLITVALYKVYVPEPEPAPIGKTINLDGQRGGLFTSRGETQEKQLEKSDYEVGDLLYSVRVRYVSPDSIQEFISTKTSGTMRQIE